MAKGEHIYFYSAYKNFPISHHVIDCGNGYVIHYDGEKICKVSKTDFFKGKEIYVKKYGKCDPDDVVVQRAKDRLNEKKYNFIFNNCEHFATWCKTGKHKSEQVEFAATGVGGIAAQGAVGVGTHLGANAAAKATTQAAIKALDPISRGLIGLGIKQAPTVVSHTAMGISGASGFASGIVTDLVVGKILEDDENLSEDERETRKIARGAGRAGSVVGGVAGTVAAAMVGGAGGIAIGVAAPAVLGIGVAVGSYLFFKED